MCSGPWAGSGRRPGRDSRKDPIGDGRWDKDSLRPCFRKPAAQSIRQSIRQWLLSQLAAYARSARGQRELRALRRQQGVKKGGVQLKRR